MAVWQFNVTVIPKIALIEKYGYIPDKLFVDLKERQQFQKNKIAKEEILDSDFQDALTRNWWHLTDIPALGFYGYSERNNCNTRKRSH